MARRHASWLIRGLKRIQVLPGSVDDYFMIRVWLPPLAFAGLFSLATMLVPSSEPGQPPLWMALAGAVAGLSLSAVLLRIAWSAGEWTPTFFALGCTSMAVAGVVHLWVYEPAWLSGSISGAATAPVAGMTLGGAWFGLGAIPRRPLPESRRFRPRVQLVTLALLTVVMLTAAAVLAPNPPRWALRLPAGIACTGYLYTAWQMLQAFRLLRLPYQFAMASGSLLFIPITICLAAGGMPFLTPATQQAVLLLAASFPAAGFVIEHRKRPGLRTMVLALSIPGAIRTMRRGYSEPLLAMLRDVDDYDASLRGHIDRVADLSVRTAETMRVDPGCLREVMLAGQLHDIGKLFVPREILDKPGRLEPAEFARMQEHSVLGAHLVERVPELAGAALAVRQHHERWDGTGYPSGLSAEGIALSARIIAAADVFDALVTARPYKRSWSRAEALDELRRGSGTHFDPRVVRAMEAVFAQNSEFEAAA